MIDPATQIALHERLLAGDRTATAEMAEVLLDPLVAQLRRDHRVDDDLLLDAAIDALTGYFKAPERFDPAKRGLFGYLVMAATGDLRNALDKLKRRRRHEVTLSSFSDVELVRAARNKGMTEEDPVARLDAEAQSREAETRARKTDALFSDPKDRRLSELVRIGERRTEVYARLLDIEGLSPEEQRREVKRHKDRIKKRLERHEQDTRKR